MTVSSTAVSSGPFVPNGVTTTFAVSHPTISSTEIEVRIDDAVVSPLLYTFDRDADGTGEVVFTTAPTGSELVIYSKPNFLQPVEFERYAPMFPDQLNPPLDAAAIRDLYLLDRINHFEGATAEEDLLATAAARDEAEAAAAAAEADRVRAEAAAELAEGNHAASYAAGESDVVVLMALSAGAVAYRNDPADPAQAYDGVIAGIAADYLTGSHTLSTATGAPTLRVAGGGNYWTFDVAGEDEWSFHASFDSLVAGGTTEAVYLYGTGANEYLFVTADRAGGNVQISYRTTGMAVQQTFVLTQLDLRYDEGVTERAEIALSYESGELRVSYNGEPAEFWNQNTRDRGDYTNKIEMFLPDHIQVGGQVDPTYARSFILSKRSRSRAQLPNWKPRREHPFLKSSLALAEFGEIPPADAGLVNDGVESGLVRMAHVALLHEDDHAWYAVASWWMADHPPVSEIPAAPMFCRLRISKADYSITKGPSVMLTLPTGWGDSPKGSDHYGTPTIIPISASKTVIIAWRYNGTTAVGFPGQWESNDGFATDPSYVGQLPITAPAGTMVIGGSSGSYHRFASDHALYPSRTVVPAFAWSAGGVQGVGTLYNDSAICAYGSWQTSDFMLGATSFGGNPYTPEEGSLAIAPDDEFRMLCRVSQHVDRKVLLSIGDGGAGEPAPVGVITDLSGQACATLGWSTDAQVWRDGLVLALDCKYVGPTQIRVGGYMVWIGDDHEEVARDQFLPNKSYSYQALARLDDNHVLFAGEMSMATANHPDNRPLVGVAEVSEPLPPAWGG